MISCFSLWISFKLFLTGKDGILCALACKRECKGCVRKQLVILVQIYSETPIHICIGGNGYEVIYTFVQKRFGPLKLYKDIAYFNHI